MTPSQKFVLNHFPDAKCDVYIFNGIKFHIVIAECDRNNIYGSPLGQSRKNEMLAWRDSVRWVKEIISYRTLQKLES